MAPDEPLEVTIPVQYLKNLQWMARRYAHRRSTFAPSIVNDITAWMLRQGIELNKSDNTFFASDGMFGLKAEYMHLHSLYFPENCACGEEVDGWHASTCEVGKGGE